MGHRGLEDGQVSRLLGKLPSKKSAGLDGVANEALKMCRAVLYPYLHHGFEACLILSYHPTAFKDAATVMLRKAGKKSYDVPKSWRPIALLPVVGKVLEKIIANRLKALVVEHNLLPNTQFGVPGKCTTKALQFLLNPIYTAWTRDPVMEATLMGLDIEGAFNHVDREKVLEVLAESGIPDWIIYFISSFLSNRSTYLETPGHTSSQFWVDIGIPQGSPLSPLLFLFFSSPILRTVRNVLNMQVKIFAFAYIDDTYILVTSDSYATNCLTLEQCHKSLIDWATTSGVTFEPSKYAVMHFKRPYSRKGDCQLLPKIDGLERGEDRDKQPMTKLRILGVVVDHRLQWTAHVAEVRVSLPLAPLYQLTKFII